MSSSDTHNSYQLAFLCGFDRSGTTMLRKILDKHPKIATTPETRFLSTVMAERTRLWSDEARVVEIMNEEGERLRSERAGNPEKLERALKATSSWRDQFRVVIEMMASDERFETIVEKTPAHARYVDRLRAWFPDAKIVYIVRDGRAVCASGMKKWHLAGHYHLMIAGRWARSARMFLRQIRGRDYHRVRYEDVVDRPDETLRAVFEYLGYEYSPTYRDNVGASSSFARYTSSGGLYRSNHFRSFFSEKQQQEIEYFLRPLLKEFGYELYFDTYDISLWARVMYWYHYMKTTVFYSLNRAGFGWLYRLVRRGRISRFHVSK